MDNKHDKLDDFLRDQLNDSSENPSWNVPGDHVFENAINALPKKKKNNRRVWIILPLLFLAVFFGREYLHKNEVLHLENKITALEETISAQSLSETDITDVAKVAPNEIFSSEEAVAGTEITGNEFSANKTSSNEGEAQLETTGNFTKLNEEVTSGVQTTSDIKTINNKDAASSTEEFKATNVTVSPSNSNESGVNASSKLVEDILTNETPITTSRQQNQYTLLVDGSSPWSTPLLASLPISDLDIMATIPEIQSPKYTLAQAGYSSANVYAWRYGILAGGNQSWLTMKNIPQVPETMLYEYDNSQPGGGVYAFVEKPLSKRFSVQAGLGYQYYQNQSILEDKFLFDEDQVVMMPGGDEIYQTSIDLTNPLGDYSTMLMFRVSDQMQQNDIINEYTTMKQKLHTVHLDLSLAYKVLSIDRFDFSLGAGLGLGYLAGLNNDFSISCYHNGELQSRSIESPKNLRATQKWYGQAIGKINVVYNLNSNTGLILESQYRGGITSMRRGTEANGSETYIHALGLSVGLSHSF